MSSLLSFSSFHPVFCRPSSYSPPSSFFPLPSPNSSISVSPPRLPRPPIPPLPPLYSSSSSSLFLLPVFSISPLRPLYFSSPSSLFLLPVFSISPLCPLYFSSSSSLFLFLPHLFPSLSSSIFSLISLFHYSSCHDSASFAFHPTELTRSHIRYHHQPHVFSAVKNKISHNLLFIFIFCCTFASTFIRYPSFLAQMAE